MSTLTQPKRFQIRVASRSLFQITKWEKLRSSLHCWSWFDLLLRAWGDFIWNGKKAKLKVCCCFFEEFPALCFCNVWVSAQLFCIKRVQTHTHHVSYLETSFPSKHFMTLTQDWGVTVQNWLHLNRILVIKLLITPTHPDVLLSFQSVIDNFIPVLVQTK